MESGNGEPAGRDPAGPEPSAALIAEQLEVERSAKTSLEQRALGALASSGVIGSLSGLAVRGADLPCASRTLLVVALVGFGAAAFLAVLVAHPSTYAEIRREDLDGLLESRAWNASAMENLLEASRGRVGLLTTFRTANVRKAKWLALSLEALAAGVLFLLAATIVALILDGS